MVTVPLSGGVNSNKGGVGKGSYERILYSFTHQYIENGTSKVITIDYNRKLHVGLAVWHQGR